MAEEWKTYTDCKIGYYPQLLDTVRITDSNGNTIQVSYEALESFVSDAVKDKAIASIKSSEDFLARLYQQTFSSFE